jgi:hypothetical protein
MTITKGKPGKLAKAAGPKSEQIDAKATYARTQNASTQ